MRTFTDQTGRAVSLSGVPHRIISTVPSQTELLYDLGLEEEVVGITKFCIRPDSWFRSKTRIGGTKNLNINRIHSLNPDLILANKEENDRVQIEALASHFPVWVSDIKSISEARQMILSVGELTGKASRAEDLTAKIKHGFDQLLKGTGKQVSVAYLIWDNPMMTAGGDTFISEMLAAAGFENVFQGLKRYPEITAEALMAARPDYLFLSSEPYPFKQRHADDFSNRFQGIKAICVDGELFSWYGSRMLQAPTYFRRLFEQIETVS